MIKTRILFKSVSTIELCQFQRLVYALRARRITAQQIISKVDQAHVRKFEISA